MVRKFLSSTSQCSKSASASASADVGLLNPSIRIRGCGKRWIRNIPSHTTTNGRRWRGVIGPETIRTACDINTTVYHQENLEVKVGSVTILRGDVLSSVLGAATGRRRRRQRTSLASGKDDINIYSENAPLSERRRSVRARDCARLDAGAVTELGFNGDADDFSEITAHENYSMKMQAAGSSFRSLVTESPPEHHIRSPAIRYPTRGKSPKSQKKSSFGIRRLKDDAAQPLRWDVRRSRFTVRVFGRGGCGPAAGGRRRRGAAPAGNQHSDLRQIN
ncbi:hypothetical protein EVAR_87405_1 [Eumeta japonica]|uniref:Uncharacterized protein n=1 Tax=Eumeta variegata TaxID=151549 RepID=A0A4C1XIN3_EUMVA|nr:hypothetical protein EVAR_87405_1 [Eumeta japonica]